MNIHRAAEEGYREVADRYERGRAGYPGDAVAALLGATGVDAGTRVVELGPGTGKFTAALVDAGARVVAVEPVADMRRKLAERVPGLDVRDGTAEAIPAGDESVDAVIAAQAFHWFDGERALAEIARVLVPGGALGLIWNVIDRSPSWVEEIWSLIDAHEGDAPRYYKGEWQWPFETTELFSPLEAQHFGNNVPMTVEGIVDRVLSISFIAALPDGERAGVAAEVKRIASAAPTPLVLPYRVDVFYAGSMVTTAL